MLSRMPRPRCATASCAALGGKLSRNTGRCARCGGVKVVDRYTRADGSRFDRERESGRERPNQHPSSDVHSVAPGASALAESSFVFTAAAEKLPAKHCNAVLASTKLGSTHDEGSAVQPQARPAAKDQRTADLEAPSLDP